jgi:hypothetical protein
MEECGRGVAGGIRKDFVKEPPDAGKVDQEKGNIDCCNAV